MDYQTASASTLLTFKLRFHCNHRHCLNAMLAAQGRTMLMKNDESV